MTRIPRIKNINEDTWALILIAVFSIYLIIISLISKGLYGDTDSITHYEIARYSFKYPRLLVSHWGKPLFTVLSAPFAQFGLQGSILFNILCGMVTAWLVYRIARQLNYRYALAAIPFTLLAPVYMVNLFTSLTEILFALVLVAAIYYFLRQKYILAAIIISFIPYARTEGIMFLPIFLVCFLAVRNYKAIPFLLSGFIIFSIAGYFHYKDFFWFFTAMPYNSNAYEIYGSGSFWYYLERFHHLLGLPLTILGGIGLIYLVIMLFRLKRPSLANTWVTEYFLLIGSFIAYILVQSVLWWQGWMAVLASNRFMACIMPLGAFLAVVGLDVLLSYTRKRKWVTNYLLAIIIGLVIFVPYTLNEIPAPLIKGAELMKKTAHAFKYLDRENKRIVYFDPKFTFYLHEDPYATNKVHMGIPDRDLEDLGLVDSAYLVWDTHFAEFERKLSLEFLLNSPHFRLIDGFLPTTEFRFFTGRYFMSYIFQKVPAKSQADQFRKVEFIDFENPESPEIEKRLSKNVALSGNYSNKIYADQIYSISVRKQLKELSTSKKVIFWSTIKAFIPEGADPEKLLLVLEVRQTSNDMFRYYAVPASFFKPKFNEWSDISLVTPLQIDIPEDGYIKLYAWYNGKDSVFVDNMNLEVLDLKETE